MTSTTRGRAILLAGVAAISTAALLIRWCDAPSLVIATYRLGLATLLLLPFAGPRQRRPGRERGGWWAVGAGRGNRGRK